MPYDSDDIDIGEINRLLENSVTNSPSFSEKPTTNGPEQDVPSAPKVSGTGDKNIQHNADKIPDADAPTRPASTKASDSAQKTATSQPGKPAAQKTATSQPGKPAVQKTTTGQPGKPAAQKTATGQPGKPAAQKTATGQPGKPAAQKTATGQPGKPAAQKTTTGQPGKPAAQKTATSRPGTPATTQKRPKTVDGDSRRDMELASRQQALSPSDKDSRKPTGEASVRTYDISPSGKLTQRVEPDLDTGSAKFKVKFDFDSAYRDVPENRPIRRRREKRTGFIGGILYAAFVICISLVLASLIWMCAVDVLGFGAEDEQVNVTVPQGFTIEDITERLYAAGLIRYKFLFNLYAGYSNAEEKITAGQYVLNMSFDYRALVQGMTARAGERVERSVTIPEGFTLAQIFALLDDHGICSSVDDLWEVAKNYDFQFSFLDSSTLGDELRLEGFLFPETYSFYIDSTPVQAITKFLREFDRRLTEQYTERTEDMGYSVRDIIIIASMIEREAGSDEERPRIAAVIYNRLNSGDFPFLQIDATIHYAIAGTGRTFSIDIDSPYNTYLFEDLPPGPIANPGMASIRAALYPDSTNEYYYALNRSGTHDFFRTLAQQQAFVQSDQYGGR